MIQESIKFILERYKAGGSNRFVCPQCGRKKCFTRYVDADTGEYLDENCGKCDHTASCGYHYPPREFFRDHPDRMHGKAYQPEYINGKPLVGMGRRWQEDKKWQRDASKCQTAERPMASKPPQTEFFPLSWAEEGTDRSSTFRNWFERLPFVPELIHQVLLEYFVGGTSYDIVVRGINYGKAVIFWQIDEQLQVHDAKLMAYQKDRHRVSGWGNSMRSICEKARVGPQLSETDKVLFGLHLLPYYPQKTVCIVESEKTALVCACQYPQHLWMATGGCGNLQASKLQPLKGRKLMVFPDSGEYGKWACCMKESGIDNYQIVDFMEQYETNTDIADVILGEAVREPNHHTFPSQVPYLRRKSSIVITK